MALDSTSYENHDVIRISSANLYLTHSPATRAQGTQDAILAAQPVKQGQSNPSPRKPLKSALSAFDADAMNRARADHLAWLQRRASAHDAEKILWAQVSGKNS